MNMKELRKCIYKESNGYQVPYARRKFFYVISLQSKLVNIRAFMEDDCLQNERL